MSRISIHAPTNGATLVPCDFTLTVTSISIHAPTNGATSYEWAFCKGNMQISIHAPTNGATHPVQSNSHSISISIHAPTNGATVKRSHTIKTTCYFNPRSDERSDVRRKCWRCLIVISIHAPTNGATQTNMELHVLLLFQSTLRRTERLFLINLWSS